MSAVVDASWHPSWWDKEVYHHRQEASEALNSGKLVDPRRIEHVVHEPKNRIVAVGDHGEGSAYMVQKLSCGHRLLRPKNSRNYEARSARCPFPECRGETEWQPTKRLHSSKKSR